MNMNARNFTPQDAMTSLGLGLLNLNQNQEPIQALFPSILQKALENPLTQNTTNEAIPPPLNEAKNNDFGGDTLSKLMGAIGKLESSNNYQSVGPMTKKGDRAFGRYQVMGANIPAWTKEVLGRSLTPSEFLQDQRAQDAVAQAKLGGYLNKYGNINDAAALWFSGRPLKNNQSKDILGTSVPDYIKKINQYFYA